jgi:hypothetical protein
MEKDQRYGMGEGYRDNDQLTILNYPFEWPRDDSIHWTFHLQLSI